MAKPIFTIARIELIAVSRLWWIRLFTVAFGLVTIAVSETAAVTGDASADDVFARLSVALLPPLLLMTPLAALLAGVSTVAHDEQSSSFLLAQPVSIAELVLGRWIGHAIALTAAIGAGLGGGGCIVLAMTGSPDVIRFVWLMVATVVLALAFLSIATLIAVRAPNRGAAIGVAAFVWFAAVVFYDAAALAAAISFTGRAGARVLFASVFGNVVDLVRILTLAVSGTPQILGVAGDSWMRALGGSASAAALSAVSLAAWVLLPLAAAMRIMSKRDV